MIALDTNVLVRFITQDDSEQTSHANHLIEGKSSSFFLSDIVLAETVWVLARSYHWKREEICSALDMLFTANDLVFEDFEGVVFATQQTIKGGDWADHLLRYKSEQNGCTHLVSFDTAFGKRYPDFVVQP